MKIRDVLLSEYGRASSIPSPVNRLMTDFAIGFRDGRDINLGVGYVNEQTIPHQQIQLACESVLAQPKKYRASLNYGGAQGSPNLIESLRRFHSQLPKPKDLGLSPNNVSCVAFCKSKSRTSLVFLVSVRVVTHRSPRKAAAALKSIFRAAL